MKPGSHSALWGGDDFAKAHPALGEVPASFTQEPSMLMTDLAPWDCWYQKKGALVEGGAIQLWKD